MSLEAMNTEETIGEQAADAANLAPEIMSGEFDLSEKLQNAFLDKVTGEKKVEAAVKIAESFAKRNQRAIELLNAMSPEERQAIIEKGVTGVEMSTIDKILAVISPSRSIARNLILPAISGGIKRHLLAQVIPDGWIGSIEMLASQPTVLAMIATGMTNASEAEAQAATQAWAAFASKSGKAAKVTKVAGAVTAQPEIVAAGDKMGQAASGIAMAVSVMPQVRARMEVTRERGAEHTEVKKADPVAELPDQLDEEQSA